MAEIELLDISKWQGQPAFDLIPPQYRAILAKSTEGNGYIDPEWSRNIREIRRIGRIPGAFHYGREDLGNPPEREADFWLNVLGNPTGMILQADMEIPNGGSAAWCQAFCDRVRDQLQGYPCLFYSYWSWITSRGFWQHPGMAIYPLWFAWPASNGEMPTPLPWSRVTIQQDGVVQVPGITGDVDFDRFFGTLPELLALTVGGHLAPQEKDMQPICATADPVTDGKVFIVEQAFQLPDGRWFPVGPKRYIPDGATDGVVRGFLDLVKVDAFLLDRCLEAEPYATGQYPAADPDAERKLLDALKAEVDALQQPAVDVNTLAPILAAALLAKLPQGADPVAIAAAVADQFAARLAKGV